MCRSILLIDYENIQNINFSIISGQDIEIKIFVGQSQNKIPFELVQATQNFGSNVDWIKVEGSGSDSLDFHIAFYLGKLSHNCTDTLFYILSKDKGFDSLVRYLCKQNIQCQRIEDLAKISTASEVVNSSNQELASKIIKNLAKIEQAKRPKKRKTLTQYIRAHLAQEQLDTQQLNTVIEMLFMQEKIIEASDRIRYSF